MSRLILARTCGTWTPCSTGYLGRRSRGSGGDEVPPQNKMKARVFVTLKPSVFDPQGHTIVEALHSLGYGDVADVRQGKFFEIDLNVDDAAAAEKLAAEVADRVLANP